MLSKPAAVAAALDALRKMRDEPDPSNPVPDSRPSIAQRRGLKGDRSA